MTQRNGYNLSGFSDLVGTGWYILCTQEMACTVFLLSVVQEQVKAWPRFLHHLLDHGWLVVVMRLSPGLAEVPPYIEPARASEDG